MIDITLKYQFGVFVDASTITPTPETSMNLLQLFKDKGFVPSTFRELGPKGTAPRPRLSTTNEEWAINIATNRIDVVKSPTDLKGTNLGSLTAFNSTAVTLSSRIMKQFKLKANRLAFITEYFLREMTESDLDLAYHKLFQPLKFYDQNTPFEWDWRLASKTEIKMNTRRDKLNAILGLKRVRGEFGEEKGTTPFDRIRMTLDLNTTQDDREYRFTHKDLRTFLSSTMSIHKRLVDEVKEVLLG